MLNTNKYIDTVFSRLKFDKNKIKLKKQIVNTYNIIKTITIMFLFTLNN
jgi:hypothetical protein